MEKNTIFCGDCLETMKCIDDRSIDMILCDLPYGTTHCKWDVIIPFDKLWEQYERIIKDDGAIVLFSTQPFTSFLVMSNLKLFRYSLVWEKERPTNIFFVKKQFAKVHEDICVFYKHQPYYSPQKEKRIFNTVGVGDLGESKTHKKQKYKYSSDYDKTTIYPRSVVRINRDTLKGALHPTQKPVELCSYLVKSFSKENDIVLDNCIGSGTTIISCLKNNRNFIGIEKEEKYIEISLERIRNNFEVEIVNVNEKFSIFLKH